MANYLKKKKIIKFPHSSFLCPRELLLCAPEHLSLWLSFISCLGFSFWSHLGHRLDENLILAISHTKMLLLATFSFWLRGVVRHWLMPKAACWWYGISERARGDSSASLCQAIRRISTLGTTLRQTRGAGRDRVWGATPAMELSAWVVL